MDAIKSAFEKELDEGLKFADDSPYPDPSDMMLDVYVN
jgi:TPP-dependent pyruvate/acetoin dehydrogenase alpha subunit